MGATVVVVALLLPVVAELLAFVAPVEFVSMETPASIIVELLGPAPNVKRVPAEWEINCWLYIEITTYPCWNIITIVQKSSL